MTLKSIFVWVFFMGAVPFMSSCSLDNNGVAFHFVNLQIAAVEMPATFALYETYQIKVTYIRPSNCTIFEGFDFTKSQTTGITVVAVGSVLDDESCAKIPDEVVEYFTFTCNYDNPYIFRFWSGINENGNDEFLEYEVPVIADSP